MCLAVPGKIKKINGEMAVIDYGGIKKEANVSFLKDAKKDDWVLVHVGFAIEKVDKEKAEGLYNLLAESD